jgi:hypothetical protein
LGYSLSVDPTLGREVVGQRLTRQFDVLGYGEQVASLTVKLCGLKVQKPCGKSVALCTSTQRAPSCVPRFAPQRSTGVRRPWEVPMAVVRLGQPSLSPLNDIEGRAQDVDGTPSTLSVV